MPMDVSLLNLLNHFFKLELKECLNLEIQEHFACEIRLQENFFLWNPEYSPRNPESHYNGNPESKFH